MAPYQSCDWRYCLSLRISSIRAILSTQYPLNRFLGVDLASRAGMGGLSRRHVVSGRNIGPELKNAPKGAWYLALGGPKGVV